MITRKETSGKVIFKAALCFALVTAFCFNGFTKNPYKDMKARKQLVEKYRDYKLIRARLETILVIGLNDVKDDHWEEVNKFFDSPYDIANEKSPKATEALVDLLDFRLGTIVGGAVEELISVHGREAIPFLKRKITKKPLSSEREIRERNKVIVDLVKMISWGIKYLEFEDHYGEKEIVKSYLFYAQMDLEKYYCKKGYYPKKLSEAFPDLGTFEEEILHQRFYYKSYGQIYFLCALGEDGKFGTKDDVKPPYNTEVFSFPENFKE